MRIRLRCEFDRPFVVDSFEGCARLYRAEDDYKYLREAEAYHDDLTKYDAEKISDLQSQLTLLKTGIARRSAILGELNLTSKYFLPAIRYFEEAAAATPDECGELKLNYENAAENARQEQARY